jgi:hypothetical protein
VMRVDLLPNEEVSIKVMHEVGAMKMRKVG